VPIETFVIFLALGACALAVWIQARFPNVGPDGFRRVFVHILAAALVIQFPLADAMRFVLSTGGFTLAAIGIALPALTYLFLSSLWLLREAQRLLPGVR
jgi:hypothetical protein